jgi:hypothetical protein
MLKKIDNRVLVGMSLVLLGIATMFFEATRPAWPLLIGFGGGLAIAGSRS